MQETDVFRYLYDWLRDYGPDDFNPLRCSTCIIQRRGYYPAALTYLNLLSQTQAFSRTSGNWLNAISKIHQDGELVRFRNSQDEVLTILMSVQQAWIDYASVVKLDWHTHRESTHQVLGVILSTPGQRAAAALMTLLLCHSWRSLAGTLGFFGSTPFSEVFNLEKGLSEFRNPADQLIFANYLYSNVLVLVSCTDFWRIQAISHYKRLLDAI